MAGAQLRFLDDEPQAWLPGERRLDLVALVANHEGDRGRAKCAGGGDDMLDEGHAAERMEHLGPGGLHAGALAGRKDDDVDVRSRAHDVSGYRRERVRSAEWSRFCFSTYLLNNSLGFFDERVDGP